MLHVLQLILSRVLLPFSWEELNLIQWTRTITLLFSCLALCKSSLPVSDVRCHWAFHSTANSTLATDQLSLPRCMGLEKFCKAAHEDLSCSFFFLLCLVPLPPGLRTCPWWCHLAPRWRLCHEVLQQCADNTWPVPHRFLFCMCRVLLTPTFQAAMSSSSTLKRRASRSTIGCRKEEGACSPPPALPGPHCWERAERAGKAIRLKQIIFVSVSAGDTWINMLLKLLVLTRCYWSRSLLLITA